MSSQSTILHILRLHFPQRQSYICFVFLWNWTEDEEIDLPSLYWKPWLHKSPCQLSYSVWSSKCSTKPLQIINIYSINGPKLGFRITVKLANSLVVCVWCGFWTILKISWSTYKQGPRGLKHDFYTLETTITHFYDRFNKLVQICFIKRNGQSRYKCFFEGTIFTL